MNIFTYRAICIFSYFFDLFTCSHLPGCTIIHQSIYRTIKPSIIYLYIYQFISSCQSNFVSCPATLPDSSGKVRKTYQTIYRVGMGGAGSEVTGRRGGTGASGSFSLWSIRHFRLNFFSVGEIHCFFYSFIVRMKKIYIYKRVKNIIVFPSKASRQQKSYLFIDLLFFPISLLFSFLFPVS